MPGFGEKLRSEREARNVSIEKIADETGIQRDYFEALETNEFGTLPGRSFGKLYIRAYARMLGMDPQPLIEEYDRELQRAARETEPAPGAGAPSSRPVGSMITNWRQARIEERRRLADQAKANEEAVPAPEDIEEDEAALDDAYPANVEDVSQAFVEDFAAPSRAVAEVVAPGTSDDEETVRASPDPASPTTPAPTPRPRKPALVVMAMGLLVVLSAFVVLAVTSWRSEGPGAARVVTNQGPSPRAVTGPPPITPGNGTTRPSGAPSTGSASIPPRTPVPQPPPAGAIPGPRPSSAPRPEASRGTPAVPAAVIGAGDGALSVTESALGRRIVDHRVSEPGDRFAEGTIVWFQTRVVGGHPGDVVRHVWIHEGRAVQSIRLPVGRSDWRTQSRKTILHLGTWAVEARDEAGRVLARADFTCEPSAR